MPEQQPGHHDGEHAGRMDVDARKVDFLGQDVGDPRSQHRDRDVGEVVLQPAANLADDERHGQADGGSSDGGDEKAQADLPEPLPHRPWPQLRCAA